MPEPWTIAVCHQSGSWAAGKILRHIMSDCINAGEQILKTTSKKSPAMSQKWRDFVVEKLGAEEDDGKRSKMPAHYQAEERVRGRLSLALRLTLQEQS